MEALHAKHIDDGNCFCPQCRPSPIAVTLRSLGIDACEHPLLTGDSPRNMTRCPFCDAKLKGGRYVGGSIDHEIKPPFDLAARKAAERMLQEDAGR